MSAVQLKEKYQMLPSMQPEQFEALKADIAERGVLTPIDVDEEGCILDGHHRYRACVELGITEFPTIIRPGMSEEERRLFARKSNMLRRHLSREQIRQLVAEQLKDTPNWANNRIASALGVDDKTVRTVRDSLEELRKFRSSRSCSAAMVRNARLGRSARRPSWQAASKSWRGFSRNSRRAGTLGS